MTEEIILITILGGLAALDKTEAYQTMLSQPLVIGSIVGFLLKDLSMGIKMGILFQLTYLWVLPLGTAIFPDPTVGGIVGSFGFITLSQFFPEKTDLVFFFVFLYVVPFSLLAGWSLTLQRKLNLKLIPKVDLDSGKAEISKINNLFFFGLLTSFGRGVILTGLGILGLFILVKSIIGFLSFIPDHYSSGIQIPILGFGIGSMFHFFGKRKNFVWLGLGLGLGIAFILV